MQAFSIISNLILLSVGNIALSIRLLCLQLQIFQKKVLHFFCVQPKAQNLLFYLIVCAQMPINVIKIC